MDIRNIQFELRKRRLDEIFDFALIVIRSNIGSYAKYSIPGIIFFVGINTFLIYLLKEHNEGMNPQWASWEHLLMAFILIWEQSLFVFPLILLNGNLVFEKTPIARNVFQKILKPLLLYYRRAFLWRSMKITILAPLLVPIWSGYIKDFFLGETILLERLHSSKLGLRLNTFSRGRSDRTVAFILLDLFLGLVFVFTCLLAYSQLSSLLSFSTKHWALSSIPSLLSPITHFLIFTYFIIHSSAKFIYYLDIRSELEGWDIELLLHKGVMETEI